MWRKAGRSSDLDVFEEAAFPDLWPSG